MKTVQDAYDYYGGKWPEGATHIITTGSEWRYNPELRGELRAVKKFDDGILMGVFNRFEPFIDETAWVICCNREQFEACAKAKKEDPFVPKVGEECEILKTDFAHPKWEKATILFMGEFSCVYDSESCKERLSNLDFLRFRPLKTEREKFIEKSMSIFDDIDFLPARNEDLCDLFGGQFDQGARFND